MNYSIIIGFVVFLLAVDSTFSLQCYVCDKPDDFFYEAECDNPKPKSCKSRRDVCTTLTRARKLVSTYECYTPDFGCEKYPDNCTFCNKDLCNKPAKVNSLKCYECYEDYNKPKIKLRPVMSETYDRFCMLSKGDASKNDKIRCYPNERCVTAHGYLRQFRGCVKDTENFCKQYDFENCTFCDKDFCNKYDAVPVDYTHKSCYKCYSGQYDEKFEDAEVCTFQIETSSCGRGVHTCAMAFDKNGKKRYVDCGPINNNTDEFSKKYGLDHSELCDGNECNHPLSMKCYDCAFGDVSSIGDVDAEDSTSCSQPTIKVCVPGASCTSLTIRKNAKLIGAYHGCVSAGSLRRRGCKMAGVDCEFWTDDLLNKPGDYTSTPNSPHKKKCYDCRFGDISPVVGVDTAHSKNCSQPTITVCGSGLSCLTLNIEKNAELIGAFHSCKDPSDLKRVCKTDGINCQFCTDNLCNKPGDYTSTPISPHKNKCYDCQFGDLSPIIANHSINSTNCSHPAITICGPLDSCLSLTIKKNVTLIGAFHTCTTSSYFEEDCKREEIDCQYCDDDLCNKVENYSYTAITPFRRTSSAEALKNNSVSLLNLLFIFIIIHAAL